jgi:hypothetical protein
MTVDEAIRELLTISTDIRSVAVLGREGDLLDAGPGAVGNGVGAAAGGLWEAAARRGDAALDYVIVHEDECAVAVVESRGRRIAALTVPKPAVGLLLFDLRSCLTDAFGDEEVPS